MFPEMLKPENYISGRACGHYSRFRKDFDIAKSLGLVSVLKSAKSWLEKKREREELEIDLIMSIRKAVEKVAQTKLSVTKVKLPCDRIAWSFVDHGLTDRSSQEIRKPFQKMPLRSTPSCVTAALSTLGASESTIGLSENSIRCFVLCTFAL